MDEKLSYLHLSQIREEIEPLIDRKIESFRLDLELERSKRESEQWERIYRRFMVGMWILIASGLTYLLSH